MILAAGRGERMRPLTDTTPKPLLTVRGKPLMQWPMEALARGGFTRLVVNTAWLGEQVSAAFGDKIRLLPTSCIDSLLLNTEQTTIFYSEEGRDFGGPLETAGGIARALPLLGDVFWVLVGEFAALREALDGRLRKQKIRRKHVARQYPEHITQQWQRTRNAACSFQRTAKVATFFRVKNSCLLRI